MRLPDLPLVTPGTPAALTALHAVAVELASRAAAVELLAQEHEQLDDRRAAREARRGPGPRWWCTLCSAFVRSETAVCSRCRHAGPHHFGEESLTGGNQARRARLRREHRKRQAVRR